jgi:hypothetical protein
LKIQVLGAVLRLLHYAVNRKSRHGKGKQQQKQQHQLRAEPSRPQCETGVAEGVFMCIHCGYFQSGKPSLPKTT